MKRAALLAVAALCVPASAGDRPSGRVALRTTDTITTEAPERSTAVRLFGGGSFRARCKTLSGDLVPALSLLGPSGDGLRTSSSARGGRTASLDLTTLPDDATGDCRLVVSGTGEGTYSLVARASAPAKIRRRDVVVPAGGVVLVPFPGDTRTEVRVRVTPRDGAPSAVSVTTPAGTPEPGSAAAFAAAVAERRAPRLTLTGGVGGYAVEIRGGERDAVVDVDVSVRPNGTPRGLDFADAHVPAAFTFAATRPVTVAARVESASGAPASGVVVRVATSDGRTLDVGVTDANGACSLRADVPWDVARVVVRCDAVGLPNRRELDVVPQMEVTFR